MALGLAIYPAKAEEQKIIDYLEMATKYQYEWIFTSMLAVHEQSEDNEKLKRIFKRAKELGYQLQVDVSPKVFTALEIDPSDLSYFADLGVNAIRLDEAFNGQIESVMTYNPYGIEIIINASSDIHYLDLILDYQANTQNITACHNFYPQAFTGLADDFFVATSQRIKSKGIKTAAFINGPSGKICSSYEKEGACTLESHRHKSVVSQVRELKYGNLIDDIYFSTMFISEEELKQVRAIYYEEAMITLDIEAQCSLTTLEQAIINEFHVYRGDISQYMIRSTQSRIKYQNEAMPVHNAQAELKRGDVVILNDNYDNYAKELHVVLSDFKPNNHKYNLVAQISAEQLRLLTLIKPWGKFKLNLKK